MAEALDPPLPPRLDRMARLVLTEACERRLRLATAESCTGGMLASLLTDITGCAHAFERGFVTYTDEAKQEMLGVPGTVLESDGAVSEAAARAMAEGALARSHADIAVAITGFAGRGAPGETPGLVHFAAVRRRRRTHHRMECFGDVGRAAVRLGCLEVALEMLLGELSPSSRP